MTDTVVGDAALHPSDEGLGVLSDGVSEDWNPAGLQMLLAQAVLSGSYARSDSELTFTGHDATADQIDVTAGVAYLDFTGETITVQSSLGGSSPPVYDTTVVSDTLPAMCVVVPATQSDLDVQDSTLSQVWLAYATNGTLTGISAGDVYLRSDDTGSVSAPPHPHVELGETNPDNPSGDVLKNRFPSPTFDAVVHQSSYTDPSGTQHTGELADSSDVSSIQSSSDVDHDSTSGGTAGNPHAGSAADPHGEAAHDAEVVHDGDGTDREIWVIANGASDPAGAGNTDLIFEEES